MTTISFKQFSQGKPVQVVGNEQRVQSQEAMDGRPSFFEGLSRAADVYTKNLKEQALGGVQNAQKSFSMGVDTMQQAQQMPLDTEQQREQAFGKATVGALQTGVGAMSGTIQTAFSPLTALIQTGVQGLSELDQATGGKIQNQLTTLAQAHPELIKGYSDMVTQNPKTAQFVMDSINVLTAGLGGKPALEAAQGATRGLVTGAKETVSKVPIPSVPSGVSSMVEKVLPTSESIMQRVARIPKGEQAKFERLTGKSVGQFLDETGNYGTPDKIVEKLYNDFTQSKATADEALAQIPGTYKSEPVTTALKELEGKVQRTSSPGAPDADLARVTELVNKEKTEGLTMIEINEVKRIYERRVRLDYLKSNIPEDVTRANNVDNALREWQFKEAEKAGLTNLPEINKFTQANKQLMDALGKEISGSAGNNALGLTDAILVAGGSPESIASLITKKIFSDKGVQSYVAKKISKTPVKTEVPKAKFKNETQTQPQSQEKVLQSQPNTTPTPPKGKGIRGMINFDEIMKSLIPTKKLLTEAKDSVSQLESAISFIKSAKSPQAIIDFRKELSDVMTKMGRDTVITNNNYKKILQEAEDMVSQLKAHIKSSESKSASSVMNREFDTKKKVASEVPKTKVISPLEQEAKKYKSAEEFYQAKKTQEYAMSHRPTEGVRAFDLTEKVDGEQMIPNDMYEQWYGSRGTKADMESIAVLKKIKGNPEANVTIYRASPKESFNNGDWVSFSKSYAQEHADGNGTKVHSKVVKAKDVRWAMDDVNEFGYYPENYKSQLTDIWKKANKK